MHDVRETFFEKWCLNQRNFECEYGSKSQKRKRKKKDFRNTANG